MIPLPDLRALVSHVVLVGVCVLVLWLAYNMGRSSTAALAVDAFAREQQRAELMAPLVDLSTEALAIVQAEGGRTHEMIRERVPEWEHVVGVARAVEDGS